MKITIKKSLAMALLLLPVACWHHQYDLVQNGVLCVDLGAGENMKLRYLSVTQEPDSITVNGRVDSDHLPESLTVAVVAPDGSLTSKDSVRMFRLGRHIRGRGFEAHLPGVPQRGSTLRISN